MGIKSFLKQGMAYGLDRQYEKKCASRKILYKDWVASMKEAEAGADGSRTEAASEKPGTGAGAPSENARKPCFFPMQKPVSGRTVPKKERRRFFLRTRRSVWSTGTRMWKPHRDSTKTRG